MKSFWISLCVFCLMLTGVAFNARYIRRTASTLRDGFAAAENAADPAAAAREIDTFWKKERKRVALSVSYVYIADTDRIIGELLAAEDTADVARAVNLGIAAANNVERLEILTFSSIF